MSSSKALGSVMSLGLGFFLSSQEIMREFFLLHFASEVRAPYLTKVHPHLLVLFSLPSVLGRREIVLLSG